MSEETGSILVAEIGSINTQIALLDVVDGEMRLICQTRHPCTIEPPYQNAMFAILEGVATLSRLTGRKLLNENGQLLTPQNHERDGINHVLVTVSAAGNLSLVIAAVASDISARSSRHASCSTYTSILQVVTFDEFDTSREMTAPEKADQTPTPSMAPKKTTSWIERQVETMLTLEPDVVLIAGGLEGGAVNTLSRLAHIVNLTTLRTTVDASGQQRQNQMTHPVLYAGNSEARNEVQAILAGRSNVIVLDNVRPSLERENLDPVRKELDRLYHEIVLPRMPGFPFLKNLCSVPVTTVCNAQGLTTRFVAERYKRHVLTLDIGSCSSSAFLAGPSRFSPVVLGTCGTGYGIMIVLKERGPANIARWLPFTINAKDLMHWILNKLLRPHTIPSSREDLLIEHAITREAIILLMESMSDDCTDVDYDLVIGCGGVLGQSPHHGLAALTLLDALQPTAQKTSSLDIYLDSLGLVNVCGAVARFDPESAVTVFDRDIMQNVPLATCVVPLGEGRAGKLAVEAELTPVRGQPQTVKVNHGDIVRLPLTPGNRAQLTLRPASGVRIGSNAPGVEAKSNVAEIIGSHLGVVIDARGRPLRLSDDGQERRAMLWDWLVALGIEQEEQSPYLEALPDRKRKKVKEDLSEELSMVLDLPEEPQEAVETETDGKQPEKKEKKGKKEKKEKKGKKKGKQAQDELELPPMEEPALKPGARISLSDLDLSGPSQAGEAMPLPPADQEPPPAVPPSPAAGSLDSDLASLRQTVVDPTEEGQKKKKRTGLFGKKK